MEHVTDFPEKVVTLENEWIVLPDGTRLAARIWMPETALERPVPATAFGVTTSTADDPRGRSLTRP